MSTHTADENGEMDMTLSFQDIASAIERSLCERLDLLDARVDELDKVSDGLEQKVDNLHDAFRALLADFKSSNDTNAGTDGYVDSEITIEEHNAMDTNSEMGYTVDEFGSKDDYPDGSWLGDESDPRRRVRCSISPMELFHIESTCNSAEKMALTLMDSLFDRETLATSSISGGGRHSKLRLDPLRIYAIQFHLRHKFNIDSDDWQRIKNNMDSKCRTAFRRKSQGLPLGPFRDRHSAVITAQDELSILADDRQEMDFATVQEKPSTDDVTHSPDLRTEHGELEGNLLTMTLTGTHLIQTSHGPIQVLHATSEQMAELERTHQIQIVPEDVRDVTEIVDERHTTSDESSSELENLKNKNA